MHSACIRAYKDCEWNSVKAMDESIHFVERFIYIVDSRFLIILFLFSRKMHITKYSLRNTHLKWKLLNDV